MRKQLRAALVPPNFTTWEDVFGSTTAVARVGINLKAVGSPAGTAASATITTPASGTNNLPGLIPFGITDTEAVNKFNLLGSLFVQGALMASKITTGVLNVVGDARYCILGLTTATSSVANNTVTVITDWTTELYDISDLHDNVTNPDRITLARPGLWLAVGQVYWDNFQDNPPGTPHAGPAAIAGSRQSIIRQLPSSVVVGLSSVQAIDNTAPNVITCIPAVAFVVSDGTTQIRMEVYQNCGAALSYYKTRESFFAAVRLCDLG